MILPNSTGGYTRYSQGAVDPEASRWKLLTWQIPAKVNIKNLPNLSQPGAEMVMIPTKNNDQILAAINAYIERDKRYNAIFNNCGDFVNDVLNKADDISLLNVDIPNNYFDMLLKLYGPYKR